VFKKVIGQDHSDSSRSHAPLPEIRQPDPLPPPASPSYASQAVPVRSAPVASRNVLSSDVEIKGTIKFTNDLVIDGRIEGEIHSDGNLTVGENARLKAEIKTATVVVYGKVHGNITATERVELKATAEVVGDIKSKTLSIEAGAIFVGKSTVGSPAQTQEAPKPAAAAAAPAAKPAAPAVAPAVPQQGSLLESRS
jgi:cytoskeletal protein CcmA (bactofilin family)